MTLPKPRSIWQEARRWLPGVLISIVALFVLFRLANWQDLGLAFQSIRLWNLLIALVLTLASLVVRSAAWKALLADRPKLLDAFSIICQGYLLNNLFPLRLGEIGRAVFMGKKIEVSPFHVLSTIIIERAFDLGIAAILLLSTLPLAIGADWAQAVATVTLTLVGIGFAALFLMARFSEQVHNLMTRLGQRWQWFQRLVLPRIDSLLDGLVALKSIGQFLKVLFWIMLTWVIWVLIYYVMLLPVAPQAPLWWAAFADSILALGVAIPSAPAALGVYEASMVAALSILGISYSVALGYAILMHFIQFASTAVLGFWGLARERRSLSSIFNEVRMQEK